MQNYRWTLDCLKLLCSSKSQQYNSTCQSIIFVYIQDKTCLAAYEAKQEGEKARKMARNVSMTLQLNSQCIHNGTDPILVCLFKILTCNQHLDQQVCLSPQAHLTAKFLSYLSISCLWKTRRPVNFVGSCKCSNLICDLGTSIIYHVIIQKFNFGI